MADEKYIWEPNEYFLNESRVARFMQRYEISSWQELLEASNDIEWFWPRAMEFLGVRWFTPYAKLYDDTEGISHTKWFIGGKLNIYNNCIERNIARGLGSKVCVCYEHESGKKRAITFWQLKLLVDTIASAMKAHGIGKGDFVGMCMPISIDSIAVMFACFKIGAVCMQMAPTTSTDGTKDIVDHVRIARAKMFFMADSYSYGGKNFTLEKIHQGVSDIFSVRHIVVFENDAPHSPFSPFVFGKKEMRSVFWDDFCKQGKSTIARTERCNAEDVALMLFSSGTTREKGKKPKRILHTHGGVLAQICKEVGFGFDCKEDDVFYWITNFGWMMAPWEIVGALHFGATLVCFEGAPSYPKPDRIFGIIERYKVSIFGSTPGFIAGLRKNHISGDDFNLSSLRILGSTGSILFSENWEWFFSVFGKGKCPINNIIGGTEMLGCFAQNLPNIPCKIGSVGVFALGMGGDIFNEKGESVRRETGRVVCTHPFPSMTRGFYADEEGYQETYFSAFRGVWAHGDFAEMDEDGFVFMRGRSDDIINKNGIKFSPANIESALIGFRAAEFRVMEAIAVGIPDKNSENKIICFVILEGQDRLTETDEAALRSVVADIVNPQAKPERIFAIKELPRNAAAKVPYKAISRVFCDRYVIAQTRVVNPQALEEIACHGESYFSRA